MSRESEWVKFVLHEEFPSDVEFLEGSAPNHVLSNGRWSGQMTRRDATLPSSSSSIRRQSTATKAATDESRQGLPRVFAKSCSIEAFTMSLLVRST
jgi:hypothetical protein